MPLLTPVADASATEQAQKIFQDLQARMKMVPNIWRTMGHSADVLQATMSLNQAIQKDLPGKLRELAYLKCSTLNGCHYCLHYHKMLGKKAGVTEDQIAQLDRYADSGAFSAQEKDVLRFAEEWTTKTKVSPEVVKRLAESLSSSQLVTLAATCAQANWTNKFNESLAIELP